MANRKDALQNEFLNFDFDINGEVARFVIDSLTHQKLDQVISALGGDTGTPFFSSNQTVTTPGSEQTLLSETVGVGDTLILKAVRLSCRRQITYKILVDSVVIGSGRIGPGKLNDDFTFLVENAIAAGSTIEVKATALSGPVSDVEVYLQGLVT